MQEQGIKFRNKIVSKKVPKDPRIKELKYWCKEFHLHNFAPPYKGGSCGNLSFRLQNNKNHFIITGSRSGLKNALTNNYFVEVSFVDLKKGIVYSQGKREPSSESMLHFAVYHRRKDVNAVFHGHSKEILSCKNKFKIPETKKEAPYGTFELAQGVLEILDDNFFLLLKNHGFVSLGKTMKEAGKLALQFYQKCYNKKKTKVKIIKKKFCT